MTALNRSQAQYLRIFNESSTFYRWQNYYVGQTITLDSASWTYNPFDCSGLTFGSTGGDASMSITMPATALAVTAFQTALNDNYLCEIKMYQFYSALTQITPQASQILIGTYVGEVTGISGSFVQLEIRLGSSLSPVGAQVPPRKYTGALVGAPIRL